MDKIEIFSDPHISDTPLERKQKKTLYFHSRYKISLQAAEVKKKP